VIRSTPFCRLPDPATTASLLSRITGTDPRKCWCFKTRSFCWVSRKADPEVAGRIQSMNLRGIYSRRSRSGFLSKKDLAAQVLGYVGMDDRA